MAWSWPPPAPRRCGCRRIAFRFGGAIPVHAVAWPDRSLDRSRVSTVLAGASSRFRDQDSFGQRGWRHRTDHQWPPGVTVETIFGRVDFADRVDSLTVERRSPRRRIYSGREYLAAGRRGGASALGYAKRSVGRAADLGTLRHHENRRRPVRQTRHVRLRDRSD